VSVAEHFDKALDVTGIILTKMDGDARGGAALSMHQVTGKPIKFLTVGERPMDLEMFHPDRMASRILGMGDILSLYEKAVEAIDEEEAKKLQERFEKNNFGFDDFLSQMQKVRSMGGIMSMLKFLPGMNNLPPEFQATADKDIKKIEGVIHSMTPAERRQPEIINQSRRIRISKGSAISIQELNQLLKQFQQMKQVMAKLKSGGMGGLGGGGLGSLLGGDLSGLARMFGGGGGGGDAAEGMAPSARMPFGGIGRPMQSAQQAAQQKKRLEQKKQAKKSRQKNRRK